MNSLGLTEPQPENNVARILIEMLAVTLSKNARARAPCSCRPGTRRSDCRGRGTSNGRCACSRSSPTRPTCSTTATFSTAPERLPRKVDDLKRQAREELTRIEEMGGAVAAVDTGYLKQQLVRVEYGAARERSSAATRLSSASTNISKRALAAGRCRGLHSHCVRRTPSADRPSGSRPGAHSRDNAAVAEALEELKRAAAAGTNIMPASIACAKAGVTTGEWGWSPARGLRRISRADRCGSRDAQ